MRKIIIFLTCIVVLILAGCENGFSINPNPSMTTEVIKPTNTPEVEPITTSSATNSPAVKDNVPEYIMGTWMISYAKNANTGEDYSLQELYGTGIQYGGTLTFNDDATFKRYIGITTEETDRYEGTYSVQDNVITLNFYNGTINTAIYLRSTQEIEYYIKDIIEIPIHEYYTKY
ncbi:lipocalin family protein [Lacrimispora sp.]|uniref:lipocalin family protein n=1 Tax=Lacrimispora sp. TaxID=2719234 RepID=UPI002FDB0BF0